MDDSPLVRSQDNDEQRHKPNINNLPEEVLVKIMSNLTLFHRKRIRQVCHHWNNLSYQRSLISEDWLVLPSVLDLKKLKNRDSAHKIINLRINDVGGRYKENDVWQTFGSSIQRIEVLSIRNLRSSLFIDMFKYCTDLKSLTLEILVPKEKYVYFVDSMPDTALSTLKSIKVVNQLTNAQLNALTRNAVHLSEIVLDGLRGSIALDLTKRQSKVLTHLTISGIKSEDPLGYFSCVGEQLIYLKISDNGRLTDDCLSKVCELFPNLEVIDLSNSEFSEMGVKMISNSLKNLNSVYLRNTNLTDRAFGHILGLENLRKIDLSYSKQITHDGLTAAFSIELPKLEALTMEGLSVVSDVVIVLVCLMAPNITYLDVSRTNVGNLGVIAITHHKALRVLSLNQCRKLEHSNIFGGPHSINELEELRELYVDSCFIMKSSTIECLKLKHLRKISFAGFKMPYTSELEFYDPDLDSFFEECPSLEYVNDIPVNLLS